MELWAYPYLFYYLAMFAFWMLAMHRQILFWLYLWQLKEYYPGRLLAWHFETQKGKRLFLNPLFFTKIAALVLASFIILGAKSRALYPAGRSGIFCRDCDLLGHLAAQFAPSGTHAKSVFLIGAAHFVVFGLGFAIFSLLLGEMSLLHFAIAAFCLLATDVFYRW